jgi:hypothetical protein
VSAPIARFLRGQADRIRRTVGTSIIQLATDLIEAKRYLSHGSFLGWVELEVGIPARTAQAYMRVAQWAHEKGGNVVRLPPSLLHLISAPSTPTAFAHAVLRKIDGGEKVTVTEVRSELKALRQARQERSLIGFRPRTKANDPGQPLSFDGDGSAALRRTVVILARGLSRSDLAQANVAIKASAGQTSVLPWTANLLTPWMLFCSGTRSGRSQLAPQLRPSGLERSRLALASTTVHDPTATSAGRKLPSDVGFWVVAKLDCLRLTNWQMAGPNSIFAKCRHDVRIARRW